MLTALRALALALLQAAEPAAPAAPLAVTAASPPVRNNRLTLTTVIRPNAWPVDVDLFSCLANP